MASPDKTPLDAEQLEALIEAAMTTRPGSDERKELARWLFDRAEALLEILADVERLRRLCERAWSAEQSGRSFNEWAQGLPDPTDRRALGVDGSGG